MFSDRRVSLRAARVLSTLLVVLALAACTQGCSDDDNPVTPGYEFADLEARTLALVNQHRASKGLGSLSSNDVIVEQARQHSSNMAKKTVAFGHEGFNDRVAVIQTKISLSSAGENVAMMSGMADPAQAAFNGWLNSAGHKANMEGDFNLTGMGIAKNTDGAYYFTQIFVKSR